MSHQQKQQLLDQMSQYLGGSDSLRQVMNSPCLDKRGAKMLGFDGVKIFTATENGGFRRGWNKKRGRNQQNGKGKNNQNQGQNQGQKSGPNSKKNKKSNQNVSCLSDVYFQPKYPIQGSNPGNKNDGKVWCKFHCERVKNHTQETCFLNKKSSHYRGDEFLKEFEDKNQRKVVQEN